MVADVGGQVTRIEAMVIKYDPERTLNQIIEDNGFTATRCGRGVKEIRDANGSLLVRGTAHSVGRWFEEAASK